MNVTPTERTVIEYHLTLSAADAQKAVDSPYVFADELAEQLRAAGLAPTPPAGSNGNGRKYAKPKPASQLRLGRGKRSAGKAAPKSNKAARGTGGLQRVACPQCGQEIAQKYLNLHLTKKHPAVDTTPTPSAAAAA